VPAGTRRAASSPESFTESSRDGGTLRDGSATGAAPEARTGTGHAFSTQDERASDIVTVGIAGDRVGITVLTGAGGLRPSYPEPRESYRVTTSTAAVASAHAQR